MVRVESKCVNPRFRSFAAFPARLHCFAVTRKFSFRMSESIGIALLGCGVVGGGVVRILEQQRDLLRQRTGLSFEIRHVVVRDLAKQSDRKHFPLTTDAHAAIDDPKTQIVIELIGSVKVIKKLGSPSSLAQPA